MSEPKKDEKKGEKSFSAILLAVGLGALAVWAFIIFMNIPVSGAINAFTQMIHDVFAALGNLGEIARGAARDIRNMFSGIGKMVNEVIAGLLFPALIGLLIWSLLPEKGDANAKPGDKPAKPDDKSGKPTEPAKH